MTEKPETARKRRQRRSTAEIEQLVKEFASSGMKPREFCEARDFALSTLQRHLQGQAGQNGKAPRRSRLVRVEIARHGVPTTAADGGLSVVLSGGRRIEVGPSFEARTLERLLLLLERL